MKNVILLLAFVLIQNYNSQKKANVLVITEGKNNVSAITAKSPAINITKTPIQYNSLIVKYQENINFPKEELAKLPEEAREKFSLLLKRPIYFELKNNGNESSFQVISDTKKEYSSTDTGHTTEKKEVFNLPTMNIYKNFGNNTMLQQRLLDKMYLVTGSLNKINWKITNEKEKINKFTCTKATASIENKNVTAWFTDEIPSNDGPSIYFGLPGLILKVETSDFNFSILEIKYDNNIDIKKFTEGTLIPQNKFDQKLKHQLENPETTTETISK